MLDGQDRRGGHRPQADGGAAGFRYGGCAEVIAGGRSFHPVGLAASGLPLNPLPVHRCLGLCAKDQVQYRKKTVSMLVSETFRFRVTSYLSVAEADYDCNRESLQSDTTGLRSTLKHRILMNTQKCFFVFFSEDEAGSLTTSVLLCFVVYLLSFMIVLVFGETSSEQSCSKNDESECVLTVKNVDFWTFSKNPLMCTAC